MKITKNGVVYTFDPNRERFCEETLTIKPRPLRTETEQSRIDAAIRDLTRRVEALEDAAR